MLKYFKCTLVCFSIFSFTAMADAAFTSNDQALEVNSSGAEIYTRGGYDGLNPDRRRNRRRGRVACFAENRRGRLFRAVGYIPRRVQRRAMDICFSRSAQCRPLGCRWI